MRRAIVLAERGRGFVNPNPMVGAVVVKEGRVIGEGWHEHFGAMHAEPNALEYCREDPRGATMYVTLEPCCHQGKTPPCTRALVEAGLARVVVAVEDPNPLVAGKGVKELREAGIEVEVGTADEEAMLQNRAYFRFMTAGRPWVTMKTAMTLDGKIATRGGDSHWVTSPAARRIVHEERARSMAVVTGIGTAISDDPMLTARVPGAKTHQLTRVVMDSAARLPLTGTLAQTTKVAPVLVAHLAGAPEGRLEALKALGVQCVACKEEHGRVDVADLIRVLGDRGCTSVFLEAGSELNASFLAKHLVDEAIFFIAPKVIGGNRAPTPVGGMGLEWMRDALELTRIQMKQVGPDVMIRGLFRR
jgi:diaminohydroxyphosphoribosylaminopyrimidine deaminase/5-amino-6-(5-phosphoribosylamino)uracil reductase